MLEYAGFQLNYDVALSQLDEQARSRFVQMSPSDETRAFIERCLGARHGNVKTRLHGLLSRAMSDFDVNAVLGMYPMHLLDAGGFLRLLGNSPGSVLDVGAGNGDVTSELARIATRVTVTESSWGMRRVLARRGFQLGPKELTQSKARYDVVSCLNVLDRTRRPRSLLRQLLSLLGPEGKLLLSVPLPLRPFHYDGALTKEPEEPLPCEGKSFEPALGALLPWLAEVLPELELQAFTRAPYLSGGDANRTLYVLDAVVVVLARGPDPAPTAQSTSLPSGA